MKKLKRTKIMTKLAAAVLAVSMLAAVPAQAKTISAGTKWSKAKTVKKGTTTIKMKANTKSYVKFKATATKTYKITLNKIRCSGSAQDVYGWGDLTTKKEYNQISFKQNGKKVNSICLTTSSNWANAPSRVITYATYLPSRTVSVKLQKNQTVVVSFYPFTSAKTVYYNLTIK